jgi:hypothetical protein
MIFDTLTYSIITIGIILAFAVIRLTISDNRLKSNEKDPCED